MSSKVDTEMLKHLERMSSWVDAALNCKQWKWDDDQHDAAFIELSMAMAYIARSKSKLPKPRKAFKFADESR